MKDKNELYSSLIDWASERIDKMYSKAQRTKHPVKRRLFHDDAIALEEEFFEWIADHNAGKQSNVLFIPYHYGIEDRSDSNSSR